MSIFWPLLSADPKIIDAYAERVRDLYGRMGMAYDRSAACYGFSCTGCDENCCEERFYHHTLAEFLYLLRGVQASDEQTRQDIFSRACAVTELYRAHDAAGQPRRVMCPLNRDGLCSLYEFRLMICRLHGVPYRMRRPDGTATQGSGCHKIDWDMSDEKSYACMLDRTDLYRELAAVEIELRQLLGFSHRIKMTIAEMLTEMEDLLAVPE
jgi:Fe-S-cluster containining protein